MASSTPHIKHHPDTSQPALAAGVPRAEVPLEKSNLQTLPCRAVFAEKTMLAAFGNILIRLCPMLAASCFLIAVAAGQKSPRESNSRDISELAPEDLMQLRVTSETNQEQPLSKVGAALYVITREDIAFSGANNQWTIGIRGFNSFSPNKVLAFIDGRGLYQPLFSGVLWEQQDLPLEEIHRSGVGNAPGL
jgi:hypothetical protein